MGIFKESVTEELFYLALFEKPWKYHNTKNTNSFSVSKVSFIFLMTLIDSTNDQNICVELFKATFIH